SQRLRDRDPGRIWTAFRRWGRGLSRRGSAATLARARSAAPNTGGALRSSVRLFALLGLRLLLGRLPVVRVRASLLLFVPHVGDRGLLGLLLVRGPRRLLVA